MKAKLEIPKFKNEDEERDFWSSVSLEKYFDLKDFKKVSFPNLKLTKTISLRMPGSMLSGLKVISKRKDVPYQSYIKIILDREIQKELKKI